MCFLQNATGWVQSQVQPKQPNPGEGTIFNMFCSCDGQAWTGIRIFDDGNGSWRLEGDNGESVDQAFIDTLWDPTIPDDPNEVRFWFELQTYLH